MSSTPLTKAELAEVKSKYDFDGWDATFDFEAAREPPEDFLLPETWLNALDKSLCGLVLTSSVRDFFYQLRETFCNIKAPELLTAQQLRKFVFHMDKHSLEEIPDNYLPHKYRENPQQWEEIKRMKSSKKQKVDDKKDEDSRKPAPVVRVDWDKIHSTLKKRKAIELEQGGENHVPSKGLLDLDELARSCLAEYLNPILWWRTRKLCKDTLTWPKPAPTFEYDFIYFAIHSDYIIWQGVAHTLNDVKDALLSLPEERLLYGEELYTELDLSFEFIKFDHQKHQIAPIMIFEEAQYYEDPSTASVYEIGQHYFGVQSVMPEAAYYQNWPKKFMFCKSRGEPPDHMEGGLGNYLKWCEELKPRQPRLNLEHVGIRRTHCSRCGESRCGCQFLHVFPYRPENPTGPGGAEGTECVIFYSPSWFGEGRNDFECSGLDKDGVKKRWAIFRDNIDLYRC